MRTSKHENPDKKLCNHDAPRQLLASLLARVQSAHVVHVALLFDEVEEHVFNVPPPGGLLDPEGPRDHQRHLEFGQVSRIWVLSNTNTDDKKK